MSIDFYNKHAQEFYGQTLNQDMSALYEQFLSHIPKEGKILDAGCGSGRDSLYFIRNAYQVTAFDASIEMVKLSSKLINQQVYHLSFESLEFTNQFDGIWACASLLHIKREDIDNVLVRLAKALKQNGVLYASFKYGDNEEYRNERFFNCYEEKSFNELIEKHKEFKLMRSWITEDVRKDRRGESWFNVLIHKVD